ncbi:MAG: substrate-binding domain-containing protein [Nitrososphaerales archaeon]
MASPVDLTRSQRRRSEVIIASGRKVPDDVAITGYDNWTVFAQETDPCLTTLDMDLEHLGAAALSDLFAIIGGKRVGGGALTTKAPW